MTSTSEKRAAFRKLHEGGCFVLPNPWDIGSARALQSIGFKAIATTSAGFAWSRGRGDGAMKRDEVLDHIAELAQASDLPLNADFEEGFAHDAAGVGESARACVQTGVSGFSIEDFTGDRAKGLYSLDDAVARLKAARAAIDKSGEDVLLTGRAEGLLRGFPDLDEIIARLKAYANAGVDCLYAPALPNGDAIKRVVDAVAPKPVNVLIGAPLTVAELGALGVRRVSTGGGLAATAWGGFLRAAQSIYDTGTFAALREGARGPDIMKALGS